MASSDWREQIFEKKNLGGLNIGQMGQIQVKN